MPVSVLVFQTLLPAEFGGVILRGIALFQATELWRVPLIAYLVSYSKILAILCASTDSAIQAFIHITVPFIRPISTVISAITETLLRDATAIGAHEEGTIAQASWKERDIAHHCHKSL